MGQGSGHGHSLNAACSQHRHTQDKTPMQDKDGHPRPSTEYHRTSSTHSDDKSTGRMTNYKSRSRSPSRDRSPSSTSSSSYRRRDSPDYTAGSNTRSRESRSPSPRSDRHSRSQREYHDRVTAPPRSFGGDSNSRSSNHWRKNHEVRWMTGLIVPLPLQSYQELSFS